MRRYLIGYLVILVVYVVIDAVWLSQVAIDLYQEGIGALMAPTPNWIAAGLFYLLYPIGLLVFAIGGQDRTSQIAARAALFGFMAYMTYDLTNLATLRDWPVGLSIIDMTWGAVLSAISASLGWLIMKKSKA
nr:DUF2177 family protein [uncultured Dongia sp.]